MREQLERRLATLKSEFEIGQAKLGRLDQEQVLLRETLLRISGAIQVLEEALAKTESTGEEGGDILYDDDKASQLAHT